MMSLIKHAGYGLIGSKDYPGRRGGGGLGRFPPVVVTPAGGGGEVMRGAPVSRLRPRARGP